MMVEDRAARGSQALLEATTAMVTKAQQTPGLTQVFTLFENSTPQIYLDIDRTKAQMLGVNVAATRQNAGSAENTWAAPPPRRGSRTGGGWSRFSAWPP